MSQFIPAFILAYSNSDFTNPHEVVLEDPPENRTSGYSHMGVKYWGMETKRHMATYVDPIAKNIFYNHDAHNWLKIGFMKRAKISSATISTKWFTGNQVRFISLFLKDEITGQKSKVLDRTSLQPDHEHTFHFNPVATTECFIEIYYEGGISRINFFGKPTKEQLPIRKNLLEDALISQVSNEHYGHPKMAVFGSRKENHMVGWESARTGFGEEALFSLREPFSLGEIVVDTYLHRLNSPMSCHVFGLKKEVQEPLEKCFLKKPKWMLKFRNGKEVLPDDFQEYMLKEKYLEEAVLNPRQFGIKLHLPEGSPWEPILPFEPLHADTYHRFTVFSNGGPYLHLLYLHYPNGGIHGLKVFGA